MRAQEAKNVYAGAPQSLRPEKSGSLCVFVYRQRKLKLRTQVFFGPENSKSGVKLIILSYRAIAKVYLFASNFWDMRLSAACTLWDAECVGRIITNDFNSALMSNASPTNPNPNYSSITRRREAAVIRQISPSPVAQEGTRGPLRGLSPRVLRNSAF